MVALAPQSALNAEGTPAEFIEAGLVVPTTEATQVTMQRGAQSYGARTGPIPGRRSTALALKGPVMGQPSDYDPTTDTPGLYGLSRFLHFLGGSAAIATQATCIELTASDANTVILKTSTGKLGCLLAAADSTGKISQGFIKALAGGGPYTATMFEDLATQMADDARRLPTLTHYPSRAALTNLAYTVQQRFARGTVGGSIRKYLNFIPTSMKLLVEDDVLMWEVPGVSFYPEEPSNDGTDSAYGLQPLEPLLSLDAAVASTRYVVGSNALTDYNDGTLDPDGTCGARDVVLTIDWGQPFTARGPYLGGVCDVVLHPPTVTVDLAVPSISNFEAGNDPLTGDDINLLLAAYLNKTTISVSAYHGNTAGKLLSWNVPAARPIGPPQRVMIEGVEHYVGTVVADYWGGDGSSPPTLTDAGCKILRIGVG